MSDNRTVATLAGEARRLALQLNTDFGTTQEYAARGSSAVVTAALEQVETTLSEISVRLTLINRELGRRGDLLIESNRA